MEAPAAEPDWLAACGRIVAGLRAMLAAHPSTSERAVVVGRGEGGDRTLVIDQAAEELIFAELAALHAQGASFTAISEERGEVAFGGGPLRVVIDPIDGSMNAKRGLRPYAVSIAVADGPTMADVAFAFVCDLGSGEVWSATRGAGARLDGVLLGGGDGGVGVGDGHGANGERRTAQGRLEIVAIESAHPRRIVESTAALVEVAHRIRVLGSMALALCQLAAARIDGMATLGPCRSVDVAAGQLIVRESGGLVAFTACEDPLAAPLDLVSRSPVVAARTAAGLAELATLPSSMS
jgi:myo-inositol-1(or 4)-monophosphatase